MAVTVVGARRLLGGIRMVGTNKSLGQHWLKNRQILDEIADYAAEESASKSSDNPVDVCLEIGPGLGTLTSSLLKRFKRVIAIEFDQRLAENLPKSFPGKNLEVINGDILKYDFNQIETPYSVAGNIPYYITSPIIEKLLTASNQPRRIVLLVQKEVAERILDEKETMLSLFVKNRANALPGPIVKKEEFTPPPKVDSKVLILEPHKSIVSEDVFSLIGHGFTAPRKKLLHNLTSIRSKEILLRIFNECKIDAGARPGDLSLEDWQNLYDHIKTSTN